MDVFQLQLYAFADAIKAAFVYIFPEYTPVGIIVVALSLLVFVIYLFKAGLMQALKVGFAIFFGLTFLLLVLHHMSKLLHLSLFLS